MKLLSKDDEKSIIKAIEDAENATSGEIRLHIEKKCKIDVIERAQQVFVKLKMFETEQRNGVILYVASEDHKVVIWGDEGIHQKVGQNFWDEEITKIITHFKSGNYAAGIVETIGDIGEKLKEFFPYQSNDVNELSDEISYGEEEDDA